MKLLEWLKYFACGLCMGAADIIPGVSGGTVAFVFGIYDSLLKSITSFHKKASSLQLLSAIFLGMALSFLLLAKLFVLLLNEETSRAYLYSAFTGFVLGASYFCAKKIKQFSIKTLLAISVGLIAACILTSPEKSFKKNEPLFNIPLNIQPTAKNSSNYDEESHALLNVPQSMLSSMRAKRIISSDTLLFSQEEKMEKPASECIKESSFYGLDLWVFCCGAIAISAMLLPGVSGSYMLAILGMYGIILGYLVDCINGCLAGYIDLFAFRQITTFILGLLFGALSFSRLIQYMLKHYYEMTFSLLIGFMLGSLRALWPFYAFTYEISPLKIEAPAALTPLNPILPSLFSPLFLTSFALFLAAFLSVFCMEYIQSKKQIKGPAV